MLGAVLSIWQDPESIGGVWFEPLPTEMWGISGLSTLPHAIQHLLCMKLLSEVMKRLGCFVTNMQL